MAKSHFSQLTVALTAVVVSSVVAAAGLTFADHDAACGGTSAMPTGVPSGQWYECNTATKAWELRGTAGSGGAAGSCPGSPPTSTSWCDMATFTWKESSGSGDAACTACMNTGSAAATCPSCPGFTGAGSCGAEPNWPDCMTKTCTSGAWTCTQMRTGDGSCSSPYPMGGPYNCEGGVWKCYGVNTSALSSPIGEWTCTPSGWTKGTTSGGSDCYSRCIAEPQSPAICTTRCYPGSGGGGATSYADCIARECAAMVTETTKSTCDTSCRSRFGGGGDYSGGAGGGSTEWCFYSSAMRNGNALGYSIACPRGSTSDCHKYTRQGDPESSAGLVLYSSSSCWWEGGWGGPGGSNAGNDPCSACKNMPESEAKNQCYRVPPCGSGGGGGGGSSMRRCIYHNASWQPGNQLKKTPGSIGKDVYCKADYEGCDVLPTAAGTQKSLPVDTPQGYGIPAPRMDVSLGSPFCCEEGWSNKCAGSSMNCRDEKAYWQCLGGQNVPTDSARSRSCEEKHCWFRDGDSGGKPEPEGCKDPMPKTKRSEYGWWQCIGRTWEWMHGDPPPPPPPGDFCKKFPDHEKCKKPELPPPGTCEEKITALQQKITTLDEQVENLRLELVDAKDAVAEKNDDIRALKKEKAPREEINAAKKELKTLKSAVSKIVSQGKKASREMRFTEDQYRRLQYQCYPPVY